MGRLIQDISVVVLSSVEALPFALEDPPGLLIDDPSDAGPPSSWGTGTIEEDPNTGDPVTGTDEATRVPVRGGVGKRKRKKHGSGAQPNKNSPGPAGGGGTSYCTNVRADYKYHVGAPNTGNFNNTTTTFQGLICQVWTTVDAGSFPAEVAAQKVAIAAKADQFIVIVNQRESAKAFVLGLGNPTCTMEFLGATVDTPNPLNTCNYAVPNDCHDPHYT
jgi:hypothetical protein